MTSNTKSLLAIGAYFLVEGIIYFATGPAFGGFHLLVPDIAGRIPSLENYAVCADRPDRVRSLQFFNVFSSVGVAFLSLKFLPSVVPKVSAGLMIGGVLLALFGALLMLWGVPMTETDGAASFLAGLYCQSEIFALALLATFSAGATLFYFLFFALTYFFLAGRR